MRRGMGDKEGGGGGGGEKRKSPFSAFYAPTPPARRPRPRPPARRHRTPEEGARLYAGALGGWGGRRAGTRDCSLDTAFSWRRSAARAPPITPTRPRRSWRR